MRYGIPLTFLKLRILKNPTYSPSYSQLWCMSYKNYIFKVPYITPIRVFLNFQLCKFLIDLPTNTWVHRQSCLFIILTLKDSGSTLNTYHIKIYYQMPMQHYLLFFGTYQLPAWNKKTILMSCRFKSFYMRYIIYHNHDMVLDSSTVQRNVIYLFSNFRYTLPLLTEFTHFFCQSKWIENQLRNT